MFKQAISVLVAAGLATAGAAQLMSSAQMPVPDQSKIINNSDQSIFQFIPTRDTPRSFAQYQTVLIFGRCAAATGTKGAFASMEAMPLSPNEQMLWRFVDKMGGCGPLPTRVDALVRGTLAEGLYHKQVATPPERVKDDAAIDAFLGKLTDFNKLREPADVTMSNVMGCFAAVDPKGVDQILASRHGTPDERKLMDHLFSGNESCGIKKRPEQISLTFMRAFMAEALWRYAVFSGTAHAPA